MSTPLGNDHVAGEQDRPVTQLPRLRSFAISAPTSDDIRRSLRNNGLDDVDATWEKVCAEVGVCASQDGLSVQDVHAIADSLVARGGTLEMIGRGLRWRVGAYDAVSEQVDGLASPPWDWARRAMDSLIRERMPRPSLVAEMLSLDLFAAELRADFDQVAARIATRIGTPVGAVGMFVDGAQGVVGEHNLPEWLVQCGGVPAEWTFCATMTRTREPYVVPDATADVLHRLNPMVFHGGTGSYAGAPLVTSDGEIIGSCCVMDPSSRAYTDADVAVLVEEAQALIAQLELRREQRAKRPGADGPAERSEQA